MNKQCPPETQEGQKHGVVYTALEEFEKRHAKLIIVIAVILSILYTAALCWFLIYPYQDSTQKSPSLLWALGVCIAILNIAIAYGMVKVSRRGK